MSATLQEITLIAPDMGCGHCEATIKEAVGALPGINRVDANADSQKVQIAFDPSRVSQAQIETTLAEAGYPVEK